MVVWALSGLSLKGDRQLPLSKSQPSRMISGDEHSGSLFRLTLEPQTLTKATHTQVVRKRASGNPVWEGMIWVVCTRGLPFLPPAPLPHHSMTSMQFRLLPGHMGPSTEVRQEGRPMSIYGVHKKCMFAHILTCTYTVLNPRCWEFALPLWQAYPNILITK